MGLKAKFVLFVFVVLLAFSAASTFINIRSQQRIARERLVGKATAMVSLLAESASDPLALLHVEDLRLQLSDVLAEDETVYAFVFDEEGMILTDGSRRSPSRFRIPEDPTSRAAAAATDTLVQQGPERLDVSQPIYLGERRLGGVRIGFSLEALNREITAIRNWNLLLGAGFVVVGIALALVLVSTITRPLARLIDFTRAIGKGDLDRRVAIESGDELELLADSFNRMVENLRRSKETLQAAHDELEARVVERTSELVRSKESLERQILESRRLEDQLRQSQKMEAIGRLAAGVAHDFNNLLTAILGYSALLLADLEADDPRREEVEEIRLAGEQAASLTEQLLAFGRKQIVRDEVLDLNAVVMGMQSLIRRLIPEYVHLVTELDPSLEATWADSVQIQQVILNLMVNARDAMFGGGTLTLRTTSRELAQEEDLGDVALPPGSWVELSVTDTGTGMDAETRSHIFEPFFTTKEWSAGTGLGLSTVYGIVRRSEGYISVDSTPGRGSTFRVFLPACGHEVAAVQAEEVATAALGGSATVLVAEDDVVVRRLGRRTLERLGYAVIEARNGEEALELEKGHEGPIHLLLADVVMPGMSGPQLAERLLEARPGLRVVFMSGYAKEAEGAVARGDAFLKKPFTPRRLGSMLREVLDRPRSRAD